MAKQKIIIWALFDSGNGCYTQVAQTFPEIDIYPIGLDIEQKNHHFIPCNLADFSSLFGKNALFEQLDKLPNPDVILASPPCESFSVASAMWGGNACWKQESKGGSRFVIRNKSDYDKPNVPRVHFRFHKSFLNRINGELCAFNTIEIIKRYQPKVYVIENPYASRIWDYIHMILGFSIPFDNPTFYGNYDYPVKKPTKFKSNIPLHLTYEDYYAGVRLNQVLKSYNDRSNIPTALLKAMYRTVLAYLEGQNV